MRQAVLLCAAIRARQYVRGNKRACITAGPLPGLLLIHFNAIAFRSAFHASKFSCFWRMSRKEKVSKRWPEHFAAFRAYIFHTEIIMSDQNNTQCNNNRHSQCERPPYPGSDPKHDRRNFNNIHYLSLQLI